MACHVVRITSWFSNGGHLGSFILDFLILGKKTKLQKLKLASTGLKSMKNTNDLKILKIPPLCCNFLFKTWKFKILKSANQNAVISPNGSQVFWGKFPKFGGFCMLSKVKDWPKGNSGSPKRSPREWLRFEGNKIYCFPKGPLIKTIPETRNCGLRFVFMEGGGSTLLVGSWQSEKQEQFSWMKSVVWYHGD